MVEYGVLYVVMEYDRGCGDTVVGVYSDREKAESVANSSPRYYVDESYVNILD